MAYPGVVAATVKVRWQGSKQIGKASSSQARYEQSIAGFKLWGFPLALSKIASYF